MYIMWKMLSCVKKICSVNETILILQHVCWPLLPTLLQQLLHFGSTIQTTRHWRAKYENGSDNIEYTHTFTFYAEDANIRVHLTHTAVADCYCVACRRWGLVGGGSVPAVLPGASKTDSRELSIDPDSGKRRKRHRSFPGVELVFESTLRKVYLKSIFIK